MTTPFTENPTGPGTPKRARKPYTYPKMVSYIEAEVKALDLKDTDTIAALMAAMKDAWFNEQK